MVTVNERFDESIKDWIKEGATKEFTEFARQVFLPFMLQLHKNRKEGRSSDNVCDAAVQLVSLMIVDLASSVVGVEDGQAHLMFYNKFLFELANDLHAVVKTSFDIDAQKQKILFPTDETQH